MTLIHWGCFLSLPACRHCTCILTCFCLPGFLQQKILWKKNCLLNFPFIFTKSQQVMPTGLSISLFLFSMFFILEIIDLLINKTNILFFWVCCFHLSGGFFPFTCWFTPFRKPHYKNIVPTHTQWSS